ncbi:hypothetical protein Tco_0923031 [Tanacetum coccineum]|uniref:Uncharacterized protein n=1 Tax=Tanacetum coccineum TaxID=301880 RepID=A0ABQ5D2M9_9ASTR
MPTEMELVLGIRAPQGSSHKVSETSQHLKSLCIILIKFANIRSERCFSMKNDNPAIATSNKRMVGYLKDGDGDGNSQHLRDQDIPQNYLATFTPQKQLTPEQIFWSNDLIEMKAEALKEQTKASQPIKALTMKLVKIERKNLLIANDNLIDDCLSKDVFYITTNSELTVSRFTKIHDAHTLVQAHCLELHAELSKLRDKIQIDDHNELINRFSNLEKNESFPSRKGQHHQKIENANLSTKGDPYEARTVEHLILGLRFQITQLTEKVTTLQEQNELFRSKNRKIKQHYKDLYDSIKITHAKHIEQTIALLTKNENLKVQIHNKMQCITTNLVKPRVLAPGKFAIDVEPIPPRNGVG